jgi:5-methylcytosine-specific restriction enzyme A
MTRRRSATARQRINLIDSHQGCCAACGITLSGKVWHLDHVIPLAMGGADEPSNWQPLCVPCHAEKTGRDIPAIAKAVRLEARDKGAKAPPRVKLQSAGFAKAAPQRSTRTPDKLANLPRRQL